MKINEWWLQLKSYPLSDVIKHKHRFVVMDTDTFKEKFSFQLSGINLFVTVGITVIIFIILTTVLIAFTPLREFIPGYTDIRMVEQTYANARTIDSLEIQVANQEWMLNTIRGVLSGEEMGSEVEELKNDSTVTLTWDDYLTAVPWKTVSSARTWNARTTATRCASLRRRTLPSSRMSLPSTTSSSLP